MKVKNNVKIFIARHCSTEMNDRDLLQGSWMDFPLSRNGRKQAEVLAENIRAVMNGNSFDFIIASDTQRTVQTAREIAPQKEILIDNRILVYDIGTADAEKKDEARTIFGFPIPGIYKKMENPFKYYRRVRSFFKDVLNDENFNNKKLLIVTHEDITALAEHFLNGVGIKKSLGKGLGNGYFRVYDIIGENSNEREI